MSFYQTCRNCAFERVDCTRRASVAAGIKGLGLTAVKFRCTLRRPAFRAGQRVLVTWKYFPPDWDYWEGYSSESWPATVAGETGKGFLIVVDDVDSDQCEVPAREYIKNENLFCSVSAGKLKAIDEPDRRVCERCQNPEDGEGGVAGTCWGKTGYEEAYAQNCLLASVGRNAERQDAEERLGPKDEHAVPPVEAGDAQNPPKG